LDGSAPWLAVFVDSGAEISISHIRAWNIPLTKISLSWLLGIFRLVNYE
jgi:hypothetical protein